MTLQQVSETIRATYLPQKVQYWEKKGPSPRDRMLIDLNTFTNYLVFGNQNVRDNWEDLSWREFERVPHEAAFLATVRGHRKKDGAFIMFQIKVTDLMLYDAQDSAEITRKIATQLQHQLFTFAHCGCGAYKDEEVGDVFMPCKHHKDSTFVFKYDDEPPKTWGDITRSENPFWKSQRY